MANALQEVQNTFLDLDRNYSMLRLACKDDGERQDLMDRYASTQTHYQECVDETLSDDGTTVKALCAKLVAVNGQIKLAVTIMGDMAKVIATIDQALVLGTKLIAAAGL